jgi:hypothetical protein
MRKTLGTAVFSGMLGVTLFGLLLTPVFFYSIDWLGDAHLFRSLVMRRLNRLSLAIVSFKPVRSALARFAADRQRSLARTNGNGTHGDPVHAQQGNGATGNGEPDAKHGNGDGGHVGSGLGAALGGNGASLTSTAPHHADETPANFTRSAENDEEPDAEHVVG